ncbi:GDSL-type esterase/lipase family protein [Flavobacterium gilvum]|uniref:Uncharacterized protein n=1 Tax=Flavobacterium gilvum TaxID=1492737 RepID=A0AAC9N4D0_9FLAO|nr:GDSL-type esterase/lipase family protein [Flavobacterium gilvum]AOW10540.1 hypothetical protein EM308_14090 [Flavobacterium gilvum]KFC59599.1 G-D-S-L family lipolytic protein [Flavobacterium gilvum]
MKKIFGIVVVSLFFLSSQVNAQHKIRIACIGNSITYGATLPNPEKDSYPGQLQNMLGDGYEVMNFGVSGKTVIRNGDNSYVSTKKYEEALQSNPDIVTIKLGTNDSRLPYRLKLDSNFIDDYKALIHSFQQLPSKPKVILLLPVSSFLKDSERQTDEVIVNQVIPKIRQVAYEEKLEMIDLHSITADKESLFPDKLHPSVLGETILAKRIYESVVSKKKMDFDIFSKIKEEKKNSSFYGYDCVDFIFKGRNCKVVKPRFSASGLPWVWRARFFGIEPQADIALLDRGFHLVYCDVAELFGNQEAIDCWNAFYEKMHGAGLSKKVCLEGFSRGGIYVYRWAVTNPKKVACIYADAPVLDLKSWPGGKGKSKGSQEVWEIFKKDFGLSSEEAAMDFKGNPIDLVPQIVKAGFPMLHVVGDADDVVPVDENTKIFEERVKALGGNIMVIHKQDVKHHPHSLKNPQPIVDFILHSVKF